MNDPPKDPHATTFLGELAPLVLAIVVLCLLAALAVAVVTWGA